MARLIDANKLTRWLEMVLANENPLDRKARAAFSEVLARVKTMPDIDAVPVVRCRECKHARPLAQDGYVACILWSRGSNLDGFCHMGARMDEKEE